MAAIAPQDAITAAMEEHARVLQHLLLLRDELLQPGMPRRDRLLRLECARAAFELLSAIACSVNRLFGIADLNHEINMAELA